jgi:hypothetical protein
MLYNLQTQSTLARLQACLAIKILGDNGDLKYCARQLMIKY